MIKSGVLKRVLKNGMTILIEESRAIPKVSIQLWYNVGSRDEKSGEKGIAHFIEHMIFKGTTNLSESDINTLTHKLSGYCNAFTSYDYTGYLFDMPSQNWTKILPVMADCMTNCTFKQDLLNSELKAVIQELKMYNDDYSSTLIERMLGSIFFDHPYHHPIIGYKQDLWSLKRDALVAFYKKHYVPNNATLVIVGDVDPEQAFQAAVENFEHIAPNYMYKKEAFSHLDDLEERSITLYRDIQQPPCMLAWLVPGINRKQDYLLDLLSWIIGAGKSSRLYKKIVDELGLALDLESFTYDLFDHSLFMINFQPKNISDKEKIIDLINAEIKNLASYDISDAELLRARKKTEMDFISLQENNQKKAYLLGKFFLATGDEHYLARYCNYPLEKIKNDMRKLVQENFKMMHSGVVMPLPEEHKEYWTQLQQASDKIDEQVLSGITRETEVEESVFAHTITREISSRFNFPQAKTATLSNGLKIFYHHDPHLPKVELILDLQAKYYYDPVGEQGLSMFVADMLEEGTKHYSAQDLAQELESRGMDLNVIPGQVTLNMLRSDVFSGLTLLNEVLTQAVFSSDSIEKVRHQMIGDIKNFWDTPTQFIGQLLRQELYKHHPYAQNMLGSLESINKITRDDLVRAYKQYYTPCGSRLSIVGSFDENNIIKLLEDTLGAWSGERLPDFAFPSLLPVTAETINYPINRDQIVLAFGGLSVDRKDPRFDALLLFDQVFTGGILGSMSSRLFELRERSGLFYTIGGSLIAGVGKQPGMTLVKTIVSQDRLKDAEAQIEQVIRHAAHGLTQEELEEAQHAVANSLVDHFGTYRSIAATFLHVDEYALPANYFNNRAQQLAQLTISDVQKAVDTVLKPELMVKIRVGRI
ncbi:MAG: pitrilysin family protein [Candidatus Babeliaceae bacterium]|jgi:zinc protease